MPEDNSQHYEDTVASMTNFNAAERAMAFHNAAHCTAAATDLMKADYDRLVTEATQAAAKKKKDAADAKAEAEKAEHPHSHHAAHHPTASRAKA